jgi:hypothetical protein
MKIDLDTEKVFDNCSLGISVKCLNTFHKLILAWQMRRFPLQLCRTFENVDGSNVDDDVNDSRRFVERRKHSHNGGRQKQEERKTQR